MSDRFSETQKFNNLELDNKIETRDVLISVYKSLREKGYNPVNQIVGYILSGDPTYITAYNNARTLITKIQRDELLEEVVQFYIKEKADRDR